eukprot:scaffold2321_cov245-Pinguiococcus_pyrenoidosus.AAC.4
MDGSLPPPSTSAVPLAYSTSKSTTATRSRPHRSFACMTATATLFTRLPPWVFQRVGQPCTPAWRPGGRTQQNALALGRKRRRQQSGVPLHIHWHQYKGAHLVYSATGDASGGKGRAQALSGKEGVGSCGVLVIRLDQLHVRVRVLRFRPAPRSATVVTATRIYEHFVCRNVAARAILGPGQHVQGQEEDLLQRDLHHRTQPSHDAVYLAAPSVLRWAMDVDSGVQQDIAPHADASPLVHALPHAQARSWPQVLQPKGHCRCKSLAQERNLILDTICAVPLSFGYGQERWVQASQLQQRAPWRGNVVKVVPRSKAPCFCSAFDGAMLRWTTPLVQDGGVGEAFFALSTSARLARILRSLSFSIRS